jgi:hypothetical protein
MFATILSAGQQAVLERLSAVAAVRTFYLAGGTGLALQVGHRRSLDFDFFRPQPFDPNDLLRQFEHVGTLVARRAEVNTLTVDIEGVSTSFFAYSAPLLRPLLASPWSINLAAIADIAAMKLSAIAGRGSRKDFVDLYFICVQALSLTEVLQLFDEKFRGVPYERYHVLKSLTFFDDAEVEPMPEMAQPASWEDIKQFFLTEVPALLRG